MKITFKFNGPIPALKEVAHLADPNLRGALARTEREIADDPRWQFGGVNYSIIMPGLLEEMERVHYRGLGLCEALKADPELRMTMSREDQEDAGRAVRALEQLAGVIKHLVACSRVVDA